jgi:hypothetical protein
VARSVTSGMQTALVADVVRPCLLAKLETTGSTIYLNSINKSITFDGQTWLGNGWLRPFAGLGEGTDLTPAGCEIRLGGIDSTTVSTLLGTLNRSKTGTLYLGLLDASYALIADPFVIFKGRFDSVEFNEEEDSATAAVKYESQLIRAKESNEFRYTDQSQQALFAGDLGFQYSAKVADWSGFWGKAGRPRVIRRKKGEK